MSQTNTMAMGGGQITQNIVTSSSPSNTGIGGVLGQNVPNSMQPRLRIQVSINLCFLLKIVVRIFTNYGNKYTHRESNKLPVLK